MQPTSANATVIEFGPKRRAARSQGRRRGAARAIVSLWLGVVVLAVVLLVGQAAILVLRHGVAGLAIGLGVVTVAGWPVAGRLIKAGSGASHKQPISARNSLAPLKLSPQAAEATDREN
jgi:hypothetical protein